MERNNFSGVDFIIGALATFRVSYMLVNEVGPFDVFDQLRRLANRWTVTGELFACIYCLSIWIGGAFAVLFALKPGVARIIARAFAFSTVSILLKEGLENGD